MPQTSLGPEQKKRAICLLKAILDFVNFELWCDDIYLKWNWKDEETQHPKLVVITTLKDLVKLTQRNKQNQLDAGITKQQVRIALNTHMKDFLNILEDNRVQVKGSDQWHFTLKLWSKNTSQNLSGFEQEWKLRHPLNSQAQNKWTDETSPKSQKIDESPSLNIGVQTPTQFSNIIERQRIESNSYYSNNTRSFNREKIQVDIYWHSRGLTLQQVLKIYQCLAQESISSRFFQHINPKCPDSIFIGSLVSASQARLVISLIPYQIKYIFRPNYSEIHGGDLTGLKIGVGLMSNHYKGIRTKTDEPIEIAAENLESLIQPHLSNTEFQQRLRNICWTN